MLCFMLYSLIYFYHYSFYIIEREVIIIANKLIITSKHLKGEDGYRVFSIRVKENIIGKIDVMASDTGRSRNEIISMLLEYALDNCEIKLK